MSPKASLLFSAPPACGHTHAQSRVLPWSAAGLPHPAHSPRKPRSGSCSCSRLHGTGPGWPSSSSHTPQGTSGCWGRESRACSKGLSSCEGNTPVHTHAQPLTPAHSRARVRTPLSAASLLASSVPSRSLHARFRPWLPLNPN